MYRTFRRPRLWWLCLDNTFSQHLVLLPFLIKHIVWYLRCNESWIHLKRKYYVPFWRRGKYRNMSSVCTMRTKVSVELMTSQDHNLLGVANRSTQPWNRTKHWIHETRVAYNVNLLGPKVSFLQLCMRKMNKNALITSRNNIFTEVLHFTVDNIGLKVWNLLSKSLHLLLLRSFSVNWDSYYI